MANRLTKITTRGGDKGETSLADGARVSKADPRIELIGEIDELNSWIGVALAHSPGEAVAQSLVRAQHDLFDLGGALSSPAAPLLSERHLKRIDAAAAALNKDLAPLKEFILPGGAPLLAFLHVARTVCRRAERRAVALYSGRDAGRFAIPYLNRLSDFLFIAARHEAGRLGVPETMWKREHGAG